MLRASCEETSTMKIHWPVSVKWKIVMFAPTFGSGMRQPIAAKADDVLR
jgi:hypothetical protein